VAEQVAEFVLKRLRERGIEQDFAYRVMASTDLWPRLAARGSVGVCMVTSGPGAIHLLNGLYDAT
jgi:pyruvate dehydrogenase (quinone)